jgi:hypothetical protein
MRALSKYLSVLAVLGTVSVLRADTPAPAPAPAPDASVTVTAQVQVKLSPAEMQAKANTLMTRLPGDYRHVLHLKEVAKESKDVVKLTCVNDRLIQLKAQMEIAEATNADLQAAISNNNPDGAQTFYTNLEATGNAITQLRQDADVCAGTPELYKQEAGVTVDAPDLPDPTAGDPFHDTYGDVEPPGYASPFN